MGEWLSDANLMVKPDCKVEFWQQRPDGVWVEMHGVTAWNDSGQETYLPFDAVTHVELHQIPPIPTDHARCWRYVS